MPAITTDIGWASRGNDSTSRTIPSGSAEASRTAAANVAASSADGSSPWISSQATSRNVRWLGQLLDRVAAVLEDPAVAVDVGDRAAARGRVQERGVVGQQAVIVVREVDLAEVAGADRGVLDRDRVLATGAAVAEVEGGGRPIEGGGRSGGRAPRVVSVIAWSDS